MWFAYFLAINATGLLTVIAWGTYPRLPRR